MRSRSLVRIAASPALAALLALGIAAPAFCAPTLGTAAFAEAQIRMEQGIKMSLPRSIAPRPVFLRSGVCGRARFIDTATCNGAILRAINRARRTEPLAVLPAGFDLAAFDKLDGAEQMFAIADIERTARGLPAMAGMTAQLDAMAMASAIDQIDPLVDLPLHLRAGGTATTYGSNFAEGTANALGADYFWMYDDGPHSPNPGCTKSKQTMCWAHRKNTLDDYSSPAYCPPGSPVHLLMGAAVVTSGVMFSPAVTEIFVNDCGKLPTHLIFTWSDVERLILGR
ncbi:MAG TPA: hypothetical protein VEH29_06975 [Acidimicrobiales bacterium]|nr:hypothetical protein [Acidimicrobiales bacterium]